MHKVYKKLKKTFISKLKNFKDDLLIHDRNTLKNYHGDFIFGIRETGTNILMLNPKAIDLNLAMIDDTNKILEGEKESKLWTLREWNKEFYIIREDNIKKITLEEGEQIFSLYLQNEVKPFMENIQKLRIRDLATTIFYAMQYEKNWKASIVGKWDNPRCTDERVIRNKFGMELIRKVKKEMKIEDIMELMIKVIDKNNKNELKAQ